MQGSDQVDQGESGEEYPLHLAQEARTQRGAEFQVEGRAQRQRTCQERKEKQ
jgi:hypothetical protein